LAQSGLAVLFSIGLTYPFLNFRVAVGLGQRGFWINGRKCIGRNPFPVILCWIAGIPDNRSSDKGGLTVLLNYHSPNAGPSGPCDPRRDICVPQNAFLIFLFLKFSYSNSLQVAIIHLCSLYFG